MHNIDLPSRGTNSAILLHVCVVGNRSKQRHGDCTTTWQRVPGRDHWQFPVSFSPPYLSSSARAPGLNERPPLTTTTVISHAPRLYYNTRFQSITPQYQLISKHDFAAWGPKAPRRRPLPHSAIRHGPCSAQRPSLHHLSARVRHAAQIHHIAVSCPEAPRPDACAGTAHHRWTKTEAASRPREGEGEWRRCRHRGR